MRKVKELSLKLVMLLSLNLQHHRVHHGLEGNNQLLAEVPLNNVVAEMAVEVADEE
jgi:hypothetical protein